MNSILENPFGYSNTREAERLLVRNEAGDQAGNVNLPRNMGGCPILTARRRQAAIMFNWITQLIERAGHAGHLLRSRYAQVADYLDPVGAVVLAIVAATYVVRIATWKGNS